MPFYFSGAVATCPCARTFQPRRLSHEAQCAQHPERHGQDIKKGAVAAQVTIDIGGGNVITSTVTVDAVEDLGLSVGKKVSAVIKASEVILGVE